MTKKMYALIDFYNESSVKLCPTETIAKDILKVAFHQAEKELIDGGWTVGKSPCYYLNETDGMCFGDGCLCGHWFAIVDVLLDEDFINATNLFAVAEMLNKHTITICNTKEMASIILQTEQKNQINAFLKDGLVMDDIVTENRDTYASVSRKGTFDIHSWSIISDVSFVA